MLSEQPGVGGGGGGGAVRVSDSELAGESGSGRESYTQRPEGMRGGQFPSTNGCRNGTLVLKEEGAGGLDFSI